MKRILAVPAAIFVLAAAPLLAQAASLSADSDLEPAPAADIWTQPDHASFADVIAGDSVLAPTGPDRFSDATVAEGDTAPPAARRYLTFGGTSRLPEPAAWAMMMIGFGLAGAILRRRNRDRGLGQALAKPIAPGLEV